MPFYVLLTINHFVNLSEMIFVLNDELEVKNINNRNCLLVIEIVIELDFD